MLQPVTGPSTAAAILPTLEVDVKSSLTHALLIPARMVALVLTQVRGTTHVNAVSYTHLTLPTSYSV